MKQSVVEAMLEMVGPDLWLAEPGRLAIAWIKDLQWPQFENMSFGFGLSKPACRLWKHAAQRK